MTLATIFKVAREGGTVESIGGLLKIRGATAGHANRPVDPLCRKITAAWCKTQNPDEVDGLLKIRLAAGLGRSDGLMSKATELARQVESLYRMVADAPRRGSERQARLEARRKLEITAAIARQAVPGRPSAKPHEPAFPCHPDDAPLNYFRCRDQLGREISAGSVSCTPEDLVARVGELASLTSDVAAEWIERFLADIERHVERRHALGEKS